MCCTSTIPKCPLRCSRVSDVKYVTVRASSSTTKKRRLHAVGERSRQVNFEIEEERTQFEIVRGVAVGWSKKWCLVGGIRVMQNDEHGVACVHHSLGLATSSWRLLEPPADGVHKSFHLCVHRGSTDEARAFQQQPLPVACHVMTTHALGRHLR